MSSAPSSLRCQARLADARGRRAAGRRRATRLAAVLCLPVGLGLSWSAARRRPDLVTFALPLLIGVVWGWIGARRGPAGRLCGPMTSRPAAAG